MAGSFRSAANRRMADTKTITKADRPTLVEGPDPDDPTKKIVLQVEVPPEEWLQDGESITFWTKLPRGAVTKMVSAGVKVDINQKGGRMENARYDAGDVILTRLLLGIVDWVIFDEQGTRIPWNPNQPELLDGLPEGLHAYLIQHVGNDAPPALATIDPATAEVNAEGKLEGPTVGETSAVD